MAIYDNKQDLLNSFDNKAVLLSNLSGTSTDEEVIAKIIGDPWLKDKTDPPGTGGGGGGGGGDMPKPPPPVIYKQQTHLTPSLSTVADVNLKPAYIDTILKTDSKFDSNSEGTNVYRGKWLSKVLQVGYSLLSEEIWGKTNGLRNPRIKIMQLNDSIVDLTNISQLNVPIKSIMFNSFYNYDYGTINAFLGGWLPTALKITYEGTTAPTIYVLDSNSRPLVPSHMSVVSDSEIALDYSIETYIDEDTYGVANYSGNIIALVLDCPSGFTLKSIVAIGDDPVDYYSIGNVLDICDPAYLIEEPQDMGEGHMFYFGEWLDGLDNTYNLRYLYSIEVTEGSSSNGSIKAAIPSLARYRKMYIYTSSSGMEIQLINDSYETTYSPIAYAQRDSSWQFYTIDLTEINTYNARLKIYSYNGATTITSILLA